MRRISDIGVDISAEISLPRDSGSRYIAPYVQIRSKVKLKTFICILHKFPFFFFFFNLKLWVARSMYGYRPCVIANTLGNKQKVRERGSGGGGGGGGGEQ